MSWEGRVGAAELELVVKTDIMAVLRGRYFGNYQSLNDQIENMAQGVIELIDQRLGDFRKTLGGTSPMDPAPLLRELHEAATAMDSIQLSSSLRGSDEKIARLVRAIEGVAVFLKSRKAGMTAEALMCAGRRVER